MRHVLTITILIALLASTASAQWIMPLDCDALFSDSLTHRDSFAAPAEVCFYGTGHSGEVTVALHHDDETYSVDVDARNNVITSLSGAFLSEIPCGEYQLSAGDVTHLETITVSCSDDDTPDERVPTDEIPEFSTLAAGAALLGAGAYIMRRRRSL